MDLNDMIRKAVAADKHQPWTKSGECSVRAADGMMVATTVEYARSRREAAAEHIAAWNPKAALEVAKEVAHLLEETARLRAALAVAAVNCKTALDHVYGEDPSDPTPEQLVEDWLDTARRGEL